MNGTSPAPHDHHHSMPHPAEVSVTGHSKQAMTGHAGHLREHQDWQGRVRRGDGYRVNIDLDAREVSAIDLVVNEMPRGRHRRRGQLVLSGGNGEFVYLRGDRQDDDRLVPIAWEGEGEGEGEGADD